MCDTAAVPIVRILTTEVGAAERVVTLGEDPVRIGRADDNDVVLLEQAASRHHARIEPSEGGFAIVDLGSATGLVLGGRRVTRHQLQDGDELLLGGTRLRFVAHPGSEATVIPTASAPPSSQGTEAALPPPPNPFAAADTLFPSDPEPAAAPEEEAAVLPSGTVAAAHQPAEPPPPEPEPAPEPAATPQPEPAPTPEPAAAPQPEAPLVPAAEPIAPETPHPASAPSFVMGQGGSSPSAYTLDADAPAASGGYTLDAPSAPAKSGGYSLDGERDAGVGDMRLETIRPTPLQRGPGAGLYVLFGVIGLAASFGALVALQGVPW